MKNFLPEDDRDLVNFIQRHRPTPPEANPYLENRLIGAIEQQPQQTSRNRQAVMWAVPSTIVMGVMMSWTPSRVIKPTPRVAKEIDAIESFLIENWQATTQDYYFSFSSDTEIPGTEVSEISEIYKLFSTVESSQVVSTSGVK